MATNDTTDDASRDAVDGASRNPDESTRDPAADPRADYDYVGGDEVRTDLVADLVERVDGEVRFDEYSRQLYATDASAYEVTPVGVVMPESTDDVAAVMAYCADRGIPVLPRGGGTSLAGQAVNEAVVLDFTAHMGDLLEVDPEDRRARAQAGAVLADLNAELAPHDLKFAPDPAAGNRSTIGGAIGNNSTGAHSLKYGKTDAYVEEVEVVLADGTVTTFGAVTLDELRDGADPDGDLEARIYAEVRRIVEEEADAVEEVYPQLKRNVSGYNLDRLVTEAREAQGAAEGASGSGTVNLARLFAGSEGTLGIVTEATVSLEPVPETKSVALLTYRDLLDAMADVDAIVTRHDPAAVEAIDDVLLDLARDTEEFADVVAMLPEGTETALLVEFYAEDDAHGREQVAALLEDRVGEATGEAGAAAPDAEGGDESDAQPRRAFDALEAYDDADRAKLWKLRKSGMPILLSRTSDAKHISFIEDTAVPTENLADYVADFQRVLEDNDTFASFYAHAGPGCMHMRPLVDTKSPAGVNQMESISDAVTDLVVEYGGSVSGEHGDGRARTQWNRKLYGEHVWQVFRDLKTAFDPDWLLNPGQVCGDVDMTENLRFDPDYEFDAGLDPALNWENENGFQGMVELCHGCGGCRGQQDTTGGVMCPTYRAADEEITATRGRANALRQAMSGDLPDDEQLDTEFMAEVMDLCIGCKGCARDCPSEVDMAKLKAEVEHAHHEEHGASLRDHVFAHVDRLNAAGSALAPVSNLAEKVPGARTVMEKTLGIARERSLPNFHRESFVDWFEARGGPQVPADEATRKVALLPDTYTNYNHPEAGKAAVRVLEAAGVRVRIPADVTATGRSAHSKGFLDVSRACAETNVRALAPKVRDGWDVVVVEPSDAVMVQSDYLDLLADDETPEASRSGEQYTEPRTADPEAGLEASDSAGEGGAPNSAPEGRPRATLGRETERVAANTYGVMEYLDAFDLTDALAPSDSDDSAGDAPAESLTYHGHCHQKATKKDGHAAVVLRAVGYEVDRLDSGCCGMAGSFGYEAEHYSMSRAIGDILFEQVEESDGETVVAPGASCRTQLGDWEGTDDEPPHPVEKVAEALDR
ncbi:MULTISPECIES: FAD-binding and (Fe-S)-binding domain-containing protein [Halorussus]|uniref:FAD-binding and (Fe-S)-binding domain-containing protein n=1 Tax=Halorussus TaxID=1070314 RepID=UPI00209D01DD|nr:FAD-binding and (Fe-S)-binding domain-containing protein [Halorussus vallis]USZ77925.1 FAD-binding protein [Halorussus vallis]